MGHSVRVLKGPVKATQELIHIWRTIGMTPLNSATFNLIRAYERISSSGWRQSTAARELLYVSSEALLVDRKRLRESRKSGSLASAGSVNGWRNLCKTSSSRPSSSSVATLSALTNSSDVSRS